MSQLILNLTGKSSNLDELIDNSQNYDSTTINSNLYENCKENILSWNSSSIESKSISIIQGSIASLKDNILMKSVIFGKIYCKKCMVPVSIVFMDNLDLYFDCGCTVIKNFSVKEFINEYLNKPKIGNSKDNFLLHCHFHFNEIKFTKYCTDCGYDLCNECMKDNSDKLSNSKKINKKHENHTLIELNKIIEKFENIENLINNYEKKMDFFGIKGENKIIIQNIFIIIKSLIEDYPTNKCYNSYKSLENAEKFLIKINNLNFNFNKIKYPYSKLIKIINEKQLNNNVTNFWENIISINIKESEVKIDLTEFKNKNFKNLKELVLEKDKIDDISPLFSCEFPVLEILNIERNNLVENTIIDLLENLKLPNLIYLDLFSTNITNLKIFELIKKFKKLKHFFIGQNKFEINHNSKAFYEFPESLEEFGMTGNFQGKDAEFIERLGIDNLKIFYFSRNKICDLKYLENIKFKRLEEFWVVSNEITDIKEIIKLNRKENLKIINLKENQISNFNELPDIIINFPKLKKIIIKDNGIKESDVLETKNTIKEKYNLDIEIII